MSLTKHPKGSVLELWNISLPLMLSSLSVMMMIFADRLLLANFSTLALNAAINATTLSWAFVLGPMVLAGISEVFVAQYNGAKKLDKLGEPVWQMIWFSLATFALFLPLSIWGGAFFYGYSQDHAMERVYFKWLMLFGPSFSIYAALNGFFIGRGKTMLITLIAFAANFFNIILDIALIFGIKNIIPPMGIEGAAIATSTSGVLQAIILLFIFLNEKNKKNFSTHDYIFKPKAFMKCLRIGAPWATFVFIEIMAWAAFYWMMTKTGARYITVVGICQSAALLFYFFAEGIGKAATAIAGNFIGANEHHHVKKILRAGVILHTIFYLFLILVYMLFSNYIIDIFLPNITEAEMQSIRPSLLICLFCIFTYMFFEGTRLLISGLLTAAGDTTYILIAGSLSVWFFLVIPVYFFVVKGGASVEVATTIGIFYSLFSSLIYLRRFLKGRWKEIKLQEA